ncbi:Uma2 family endonuclease [Actinomadura craniellae]|uniref:Uma2 family endonuclease n=1 Tax=Actinomadura craniellae TaxID=2231787 RepID=UPI001314078F|nr:Uma2 family endonuclease [Actinomadura craniellae]
MTIWRPESTLDEYTSLWNHPGEWTEQDFFALPAGAPKIELIDGRLVVSGSPGQGHQRLLRRLAEELEAGAPDRLAVCVQLNVRVDASKILIPDVVATYEVDDVLVHDPAQVPLVAEIPPAAEWEYKRELYARAGIPWYLLVQQDGEGRPSLALHRLDSGSYERHAEATCGEVLELPEPLGSIDPADLLKRRPRDAERPG